ncbi:hypothetical protein WL93_23775 [Burkholderia diffusa]|uniref:DUF1254 domain-containing protein n=1 Tax=Burkholderia diffusa TaxID=488732 RepID=UPI0007557772|nr:DUF1254 domain-containing protein [Burkholderia diffusa]KWF82379.1 hypothetical protein WL93_23775 [Burkholderia diffusa]
MIKLLFRRRNITITVLAILALILVANMSYLVAFKRGVQAYLYGYPLITMDLTRQVMTAPQAANGPRPKLGAGPINHLNNVAEFPGPSFKDVVAPNADTLYSIAWLDLRAQPMVLSMPPMQGRWVLMEVLDTWTNAFASLGTRQYGYGSRQYLIAGPDWNGTVPAGMVLVRSPTNTSWIIGRTYTKDASDFPAVHALQAQYRLTPMFTSQDPPETNRPTSATAGTVDTVTPVLTQVARLDAQAFFSRLAHLMADSQPPSADQPMLDSLARLGIVAGQPFAWNQLSAAQRNGLEDAVWFVHGLFEARSPGTQGVVETNGMQKAFFSWANVALTKLLLNSRNGWAMPLKLGSYGTRYPLRAMVTLLGLGANGPEDAVYPATMVDANGDPLDGTHRYRLHFERSELPPANTFWSLSMYNAKGFFVENPTGRYTLGDRSGLHYNQDGSLDIWIQNQAPDAGKVSNWLPAPKQDFKVYLRLYDPKPIVLENHWAPPAIEKID